jgi:hypothetical protein
LITSVKDLIDPLTAKIEAMQTDLSLMRTETAENKRLLVELLAHVDTLGTTVHSSSRHDKDQDLQDQVASSYHPPPLPYHQGISSAKVRQGKRHTPQKCMQTRPIFFEAQPLSHIPSVPPSRVRKPLRERLTD